MVNKTIRIAWRGVRNVRDLRVVHEIAMSYPADSGFGLPLLYFIIQGLLVFTERRFRLKSRVFPWLAVLAPLPLLFHQPFRDRLIVPFSCGCTKRSSRNRSLGITHVDYGSSGVLQLAVLLASFSSA